MFEMAVSLYNMGIWGYKSSLIYSIIEILFHSILSQSLKLAH